MKTIIIKQMETVVTNVMRRYQSDFFHGDKPLIEGSIFKFPAIWIIGESHTHLLLIGNYKDRFFEMEGIRYDYLYNHNPYSYFLDSDYYRSDKWYLITEKGLQPINQKQAKAAIMDYVNPAVQEWIAENGPLPKLTRVSVKLRGISISKLKELVSDCRNHGNDSLMECLMRFHRYTRVAADQFVEVSYHNQYNEFRFCHYINGRPNTAGGIVFHGWPETGYQTNGSVQIEPHYGWSTHT